MPNPQRDAHSVDEKKLIDAAHQAVNKPPKSRNGRGLLILLLIIGGLIVASLYAYLNSNGGVKTPQQRTNTSHEEQAATSHLRPTNLHGYAGVPANALITPPPYNGTATPSPGLGGTLPASPGGPPTRGAPGETAAAGGTRANTTSAAMRAYLKAINSEGDTATTTIVRPSAYATGAKQMTAPPTATTPQLRVIYGGVASAGANGVSSTGGTTTMSPTTGSNGLAGVIAQAKAAIASEIAAHQTGGAPTSGTGGGIIGAATSALTSALASGPAAFNLPTGAVPTGHSDGRMHTPILNPAAYELPIGTRIPLMLTAALDSGLAGPVCAVVDRDMRDPRSGVLIIPRGSNVCGIFTGLAAKGTHLSIQWRWLIYPDLQQRALVDVATTDEEGNNGLAGRVDTHMIPYFRNTLIGSIVNAAGQILAGITAHGAPLFGGVSAPPTLQANTDIPTLHAGIATPFFIVLQRDYDAPTPYEGHS